MISLYHAKYLTAWRFRSKRLLASCAAFSPNRFRSGSLIINVSTAFAVASGLFGGTRIPVAVSIEYMP